MGFGGIVRIYFRHFGSFSKEGVTDIVETPQCDVSTLNLWNVNHAFIQMASPSTPSKNSARVMP